MLTVENYMAAWNRGGGIAIGPWPDKTGWSRPYRMTVGCCDLDRHRLTRLERETLLFVDFHTLVVRDGVDPQRAHAEFCKVVEYRKRISPDIPGAGA
ncbi:MAG: hypothetical protein HYU59_05855 [Magnetospirillum gryphiswaldense]|nr:hypothetical protein [Magnetospirillum gryphiswaldense]